METLPDKRTRKWNTFWEEWHDTRNARAELNAFAFVRGFNGYHLQNLILIVSIATLIIMIFGFPHILTGEPAPIFGYRRGAGKRCSSKVRGKHSRFRQRLGQSAASYTYSLWYELSTADIPT